MQVVDRKNIEKRLLFYWSKIFSKSIKSGQDYSLLEKGIAILIIDYELDFLNIIQKYMTKWNIREEDYNDIILTDAMEIYIIELPKFEKYKEKQNNNALNLWVKFIKNLEVVDMSNKEIKKAKEVLEEISQDEREIYLAELREKYIMDQKAIEDAGYDKGLKAGIEQGIEQGLEQGSQQEKIQIAKNLIVQNIDLEIIAKVTGLSIEEIKKL